MNLPSNLELRWESDDKGWEHLNLGSRLLASVFPVQHSKTWNVVFYRSFVRTGLSVEAGTKEAAVQACQLLVEGLLKKRSN